MAFSFIWDLWYKWNIRGSVLLSLWLQIFLFLFASARRKSRNVFIIYFLWLAYLMTDWLAVFTIGLISYNQGYSCAHAAKVDEALQAFWASFLLLHLGAPDTITIFSLAESLLWRPNLLSLIYQIGTAVYVFLKIFSSDKFLLIPTMLMFFAGVTKIAERILALNHSNLRRIKESMFSQHKNLPVEKNKLIEELTILSDGNSDVLAESIVVKHAYYFFKIFKVFIGDLTFTSQQREISREYFHKVSAVDAMRVISVELQFIYEMLYTKVLTIHSKWSCFFRFIAFTNVAMAFILFYRLNKHRLSKLDVEITYILLFGGILIDVIGLSKLVFSDWTIARIMCYNPRSPKLSSFLHRWASAMAGLRKPQFTELKLGPPVNGTFTVLNAPLIFRRWSEYILACNLLFEALDENQSDMHKQGIKTQILIFSSRMINKIVSWLNSRKHWQVRRIPFVKELWIFIFTEVKRKSVNADDPIEVRNIFEARGDLYLKSISGTIDCGSLLAYVTDTYYNDSIIVWHIATEICYRREDQALRNDKKEFSKILSDYMLYLLLICPNLVSTVAVAAIADMRSTEVLDELRRLTNRFSESTDLSEPSGKSFNVPIGQPKSPLEKATCLVLEMERLQDNKWEVISGVWVEMLSYAAIHIKGERHVVMLSIGGELLEFVWLLMAHFGCFYNHELGMYYKRWGE